MTLIIAIRAHTQSFATSFFLIFSLILVYFHSNNNFCKEFKREVIPYFSFVVKHWVMKFNFMCLKVFQVDFTYSSILVQVS